MMIFVFCEGSTEEAVVKGLGLQPTKIHDCKGKSKINPMLDNILGPELEEPGAKVRTVILRDWDEGETQEDIVKSVAGQLQKTLANRGFPGLAVRLLPHSAHENLYLLNLKAPDLRLALHIATLRWREEFTNATMDDYVLHLSLQQASITKLLADKGWKDTTPAQIIRKVSTKIPDLLHANGIPVREAKDYVRLYAALMQLHTSPPVFARKILANASPEDKAQTFASLLAAFAFVGGA